MNQIRKQREVIDRPALAARLGALVGAEGYRAEARAATLDILKETLQSGFAEVRRRFEAGGSASDVLAGNAFLIDQLVRVIFDFAGTVYPIANRTKAEQLSIVAIGGYGRAGLAPYSDVDLMFLLPYKLTPHSEQVIEFMLYLLWDLGLKVGHATRSIDECIRLAKADSTICTSLLDARWIWGDQKLFVELKARFAKEVVAGSARWFVESKLAERNERHERMGDTRYVVEPNVKEGKGGLRDLQMLYWMAQFLYDIESIEDLVGLGLFTKSDVRQYQNARLFLWTVRCHLHYLAGRAEERLTFDVQQAIAERMAYGDRGGQRGVERFMKHYFHFAKYVGDLTRVMCAVLEERQAKRTFLRFPSLQFRRREVDGFVIDGGRLNVEDDDAFRDDPVKLIRLFHAAHVNDVDIHPDALRLVSRDLKYINKELREDEEANELFMEILTSPRDPEIALRRLNESGVFGKFVPDFGRVVAQMQYDMYHTYTVDEHTIRAVGLLNKIETGALAEEAPIATKVIHEVLSRRALYVAVLVHDLAKGRGGDHSELGAKIALKLGPRFGLNEEETETVEWLVLYHLFMSNTAFTRDIDDPKTIADFIATVKSTERLNLLVVLTVADIRAVGPGVWNNWKARLLRELYYRSLEALSGDRVEAHRGARVEAARAALREALADWPAEAVERHIANGTEAYWLSFDAETHKRHAEIVAHAEERGLDLHIETRVDEEHDSTEIAVYTADHPGLFSKIAGALALSGASIVDAKIVTLTNGMALDTFTIQDVGAKAYARPERLKKLWTRIEDVLGGRLDPARELEIARESERKGRHRVFKVAPRVLIDNRASSTHSVIEVDGRDRIGFLHDVTSALTGLGLQISTARVATFGEQVVDVFYVKDAAGLKVVHRVKLKEIKTRLLAAVEPPEAPADDNAGDEAAAAE